jgi:uncharacterized Zn finger protein
VIALHVIWSSDSRLLVWGEQSSLPVRAGRRPGRPPTTPRPRTHPFALFTLRGRTKEELVQSLRARRAKSARGVAPASSATRAQAAVRAEAAGDAEAAATHPVLLASALDRFWCCGPELAELEVSPLASDAPDALLRQLGPLTIGEDGRDLLEVLTPAYVHLAAAAERHALRG